MKQSICKLCGRCGANTMHSETLKWVYPPHYLVILINRFTYQGTRTIKRRTRVPVQLSLSLNNGQFDLLCSIDHHGGSSSAGHYTSTLLHDEGVFYCSDSIITQRNEVLEKHSTTVYIMIYKNNVNV